MAKRTRKTSGRRTAGIGLARGARPKAAHKKAAPVRGAAKPRGAAEKKDAAAAKETKRGFMPNMAQPDEIKAALGNLLGDETSLAFLRKNVSKWAPDVLNMLATPKTDEYLAEQLGMKINAVRRILNLLQGYGVTNYYVAKNTNGWLSFAWYVNASKVPPFFDYIKSVSTRRTVVTNECNDYFMCNSCYPEDKLVFTFDAAYEAAFKCGCGQKFARISKDAAEELTTGPVVVAAPVDTI